MFVVILVVGIIIFFSTVRIVHIGDGMCAIRERFGRFVGVLTAGTHFLFTPIDSLRRIRLHAVTESATSTTKTTEILSTLRQIYDPPAFDMPASNGVVLSVNVVVYYRIVDVRKAVYSTPDYLAMLKEMLHTFLVGEVSMLTLAELRKRGDFTVEPLQKDLIEEHGIDLIAVRIQKITAPAIVEENAAKVAVQADVLSAEQAAADARHAMANMAAYEARVRRLKDNETELECLNAFLKHGVSIQDVIALRSVDADRAAAAHASVWGGSLLRNVVQSVKSTK